MFLEASVSHSAPEGGGGRMSLPVWYHVPSRGSPPNGVSVPMGSPPGGKGAHLAFWYWPSVIGGLLKQKATYARKPVAERHPQY